MTFNSNGKTISGCSAVMVTSSRTAATSLTAGTDTIKASYSGNSDYPGSSGSVTQGREQSRLDRNCDFEQESVRYVNLRRSSGRRRMNWK